MRYGATTEEWDALCRLCLPDIRPTVNNPDRYKADGTPVGSSMSKRAARVYAGGNAGGIYGWQKIRANWHDVAKWREHPDHGIGIVGRTIRGIDIDIEDPDLADTVEEVVQGYTNEILPQRTRPNSARRMLLFRDPNTVHKAVINTSGGKIEVQGDRQFIALVGRHKSGVRYEFPQGIPETLDDIPVIDSATLIEALGDEFQSTPVTTTAAEVDDRDPDDIDDQDPINAYVRMHEVFRWPLPDGSWSVVCPWHELHESTDGKREDADPTTTVFFPVGLGGKKKPGFKCMHESHGQKTISEFLSAIDYTESEFEVIEEEVPMDIIRRNPKSGLFPGLSHNIREVIEHSTSPYQISMDDFTGEIIVNGYRRFKDTDYARIMSHIERAGALNVSKTTLRDSIHLSAQENSHDSAAEWLESLEWDGVDRFSRFPAEVMKTYDTEYNREVVRYMFTALAGRILSPGVKADMIPVLYGPQGSRKSTMVELLAPWPDAAGMIRFDDSDADTARLTNGKAIVEIAELRGLRSKDEEIIKAWVTRTDDEWIAKFQEVSTRRPRRFLPIGTTNTRRFLSDATGNRRWLPVEVCKKSGTIDTDWIAQNKESLWAQGKEEFKEHGVAWRKAERLAVRETPKFTRKSLIAMRMQQRLKQSPGEYSSYELLKMEFGINSNNAQKTLQEIEVAMQLLGFTDNGDGVWRYPFL